LFSNALIYFWILMEYKEWAFSIYIQALIYIGMCIGVFVHDFIIVLLAYCLKNYRCRRLERMFYTDNESVAIGASMLFISIVPTIASIALIILIIIRHWGMDETSRRVYFIHSGVYLLLAVLGTCLFYSRITKP
jgi:hypothetical protein